MHFDQTPMRLTVALTLVFSSTIAASAAEPRTFTLAPPAASDLVATTLVAPTDAGASLAPAREPVSFAWPLDPAAPLAAPTRPAPTVSRGYWLEVSAAELARGVAIDTVAPGALVRVNPVKGADWHAQVAIDPQNLVVEKGGESLASGVAMELLVGAEEMARAGFPFPEGTSAFRLRQELGAGRFVLRAPELTAGGRFLVHVEEPQSSVVFSLRPRRNEHLHGERLELDLKLNAGGEGLALAESAAFVTSPAGRRFPLALIAQGDGSYRASLVLDGREPLVPGLWEAHAAVAGRVGAATARRQARAAFTVALPTARLVGNADVFSADLAAGFNARFGVETAAPGRYEVRGVLYGTAAGGERRPVAIGHAAAWLEAGQGAITLELPAKALAAAGLGAPWELRDLRLLDQGRMALLHRQERAVVVP